MRKLLKIGSLRQTLIPLWERKHFAAALLITTAMSVAATAQAAPDVHALAARVDSHYNHLRSLRAQFTERYSGMGLHRAETGTLLLQKPGRMRWSYTGGKLFVLDGKYAVSYVPGEPQAQRMAAKQLDDLRSPLRFLLGHTQLEKELTGLHAAPGPDGTVILTGAPKYATGPGDNRVESLAVRVVPTTGAIVALEVREIDGSTTAFDLADTVENVPARDADFRFTSPAGIVVVDGVPPA